MPSQLQRPILLFQHLKNRLHQRVYPTPDAFETPLILHFGYHKCLTSYYQKIFRLLSLEFGFSHLHFTGKHKEFASAVVSELASDRVYSLNNSSRIPWEKLPEYRGSHFVRDPRCLITSGYHYHLWTKENWCRTPDFPWRRITEHPYFSQYVEKDPEKAPVQISYQDYLNSLEPEKGLILEMIWRKDHFEQMFHWNYQNPRILELRYEDIVGREVEAFEKIFKHYGFHPRLIQRGLDLVDQFSLKNSRKGSTRHTRSGETRQWVKEFSPLHRELFKKSYSDLLMKLGYERSGDW